MSVIGRLPPERGQHTIFRSNVWRVNKESVRLEQDILIPLSDKSQFCVFANNSFWRQIKNAGCVCVSCVWHVCVRCV